MEFFISWTDSDPEYQLYDANCSLLISPPIFPRCFKLTRLRRMPHRVLIDSGAYTLRKRFGDTVNQRALFEWQLDILQGVDLTRTEVLLSHLDQPLEPGLPPTAAYKRMELTVAHAWDFLTLAHRAGIAGQVQLLGVIQGYDADSIQWCCRELKRLGFNRFGLGSLALLYNPKDIEARVRAAVEVVGTGLHVFGISSVQVMHVLRDMGVESFDSSRPVKEAMFYVLLYSSPFRRFAVAGRRRDDMPGVQLTHGLPCGCPVCRVSPRPLFRQGAKKYTNVRAIHNYWHLKREICGESSWQDPMKGESGYASHPGRQ